MYLAQELAFQVAMDDSSIAWFLLDEIAVLLAGRGSHFLGTLHQLVLWNLTIINTKLFHININVAFVKQYEYGPLSWLINYCIYV